MKRKHTDVEKSLENVKEYQDLCSYAGSQHYRELEQHDKIYLKTALREAQDSLDIKKKKELCNNYDSNYYGAVGVLKVIKIAQKYKIELPDRLTFRNSMDKKTSCSEDEAKNIKDRVEKSITAIIFYLNFIKIDKYYLITKTRFC
ncbi:hypothetical protein [Candidatus Tisiphia endosymbiont of Metellina segmentata]|uniref:hypothetical protein n=1 Tax=Candidatus Tisiphia endosymbiont of Metellina segmentata TaxID=3066274 RepID=UPI00313F1079